MTLGLGVKSYWDSQFAPVDRTSNATELFVIPPGQSTSEVAARLETEGLIKSTFFFKLLAQTSGKGAQIQAGDFKLSPAMSSEQILNQLVFGVMDKWVRLVEGWRVEEMARKLSEELGVKSEEFVNVAKKSEGYLFPDSYLVDPDITPVDMVELLKNTFNQRYSQELKEKIKAQGLTEDEGVILASIVEREGRSDQVRIEVASILLKRLKIGMKLDVDATVQYAKDSLEFKRNPQLKFWQPITRKDYSGVVSAYNTYLNNGLPPGPIANPSLSSLQAVANAHETPYLYYYHDPQGNSHYATTLEEHNDNVSNYR